MRIFNKFVICAVTSTIGTAQFANAAETCASVYSGTVNNVSVRVQEDQSRYYYFDLYCERNGQTKSADTGISLSFPLEGIPTSVNGHASWDEGKLQEFCKKGAANEYDKQTRFELDRSVVVEALQTFNECRALETKGLRVRHDETHPNGFTVYGGIFGPGVSATISTIDYVEMVCRSTSFSDDGAVEVIDGSREYVVTDDSFSISCQRPGVDLVEGKVTYPRATFRMATNHGPYSVTLPGDEHWEPQLVSHAQAAVATLKSDLSDANARAVTIKRQRNVYRARLTGLEFLTAYTGNQPQPKEVVNFGIGNVYFDKAAATRECRSRGKRLKHYNQVVTFPGGPHGHTYWSIACIP